MKGNYKYRYMRGSRVVYGDSVVYLPRKRILSVFGMEVKFKRKLSELYIFSSDNEAAGFEASGYNRLLVEDKIIFYK